MYFVTEEFHKESIELYEKHQKKWIDKYNIKKNDVINIAHCASRGECGWWDVWTKEMSRLVGKTGIVVGINSYGITIKVEGYPVYRFPFFCLEKVSENKPEPEKPVFKPFDRVMVRDSEFHDWKPAIFVKYGNAIEYPYYVLNLDTANIGSYSQCKKYEE